MSHGTRPPGDRLGGLPWRLNPRPPRGWHDFEKKLLRILLDLEDRPLMVIGPPGSGKTTIVTTLAIMHHLSTGRPVLYMSQKPGDAVGAVVKPRVRWGCVSGGLHMVFDAYEELSMRPGITILLSMAGRFRSVDTYVRYLRHLARSPRNVHAAWLLERLYLVREYVGSGESRLSGVNTVLLNRDVRGTYLAMLLMLDAMCGGEDRLLVIDDMTTLPIRDEALLRAVRMVRGLTNTWVVMHGLGRLSIEDLNTPVILTSHSGLAKMASRYSNLLDRIRPNEALYLGINEEVKLNIGDVRRIRQELLKHIGK